MNLNQITNDIIQITEKHGYTYSDAERKTLSKQILYCIGTQFRHFDGPLARLATDTPEVRDAHYNTFIEKLLSHSNIEPNDMNTEVEAALYEIDGIFEANKNLQHPPLICIVQGFMYQAKAGQLSIDVPCDNYTYTQLYNLCAGPEAQLTLQQWNAIELDLLKVLLDIHDEYKHEPSPNKKPRLS